MNAWLKLRMELAVLAAAGWLWAGTIWAAPPEGEPPPLPSVRPLETVPAPQGEPQAGAAASILTAETKPIDLDCALRLAGVRNPELMLARERVSEAIALRQLAAAQILPNLNAGSIGRRSMPARAPVQSGVERSAFRAFSGMRKSPRCFMVT